MQYSTIWFFYNFGCNKVLLYYILWKLLENFDKARDIFHHKTCFE